MSDENGSPQVGEKRPSEGSPQVGQKRPSEGSVLTLPPRKKAYVSLLAPSTTSVQFLHDKWSP